MLLALMLATVDVGMAMRAAEATMPVAVKAALRNRPDFATAICAAGSSSVLQ